MVYVSSSILLCMEGLRGTAHSRLPSGGITRFLRYYPSIRLPVFRLPSFVSCRAYRMVTPHAERYKMPDRCEYHIRIFPRQLRYSLQFRSHNLSTSGYGLCFLFDIALHGRAARHSPLSASLRRHYPLSSVLSVHPTTCIPFALLRELSSIPHGHTSCGEIQVLPS